MVRLKGSKTHEKGFWQLLATRSSGHKSGSCTGPTSISIFRLNRSSIWSVLRWYWWLAPDKRAQRTRSSLSAVRRRSLAERFKY